MSNQQNLKKIITNITTFGSVHIFSLLISIIRSKLATLWLGAQGGGFLGLLTSTFNLIISLTNCGLPASTVRYLSENENLQSIERISLIQKLSIIIGIIGAVLCFLFSHQLSMITFDTADYRWAFQLISFSVVMKQITEIYTSIFQSRMEVKKLANANLTANIIGILITLPLYYYFHLRGVVYNLIAVGIVEFIVFRIVFRRLKLKDDKTALPFNKAKDAKKILGNGLYFNLSNVLNLLSAYIVQIFIRKFGGLEQTGYYISGFTILNVYVAIFFTVMSLDYFPRVSRANENTSELNSEVNNQLYIGTLILSPVLILLLLMAPAIVAVLYEKSFTDTILYVQLALLGVFFKLFSWVTGFVIIGKGSRNLILNNALFFNSLFVVSHILGFYFYGIKGVAIASCLYYLCHLIGNYWVTYRAFGLKISRQNIRVFVLSSLMLMGCVALYFSFNSLMSISSISCIFIACSIWSIRNFLQIIQKRK